MSVTIVRPGPEHREAWGALYAGYARYYQVEQNEEMRARVWGWLNDAASEVEGFLALDASGQPIGLTHFRAFARPLAAATGGFLDDLFVAPEARGSGAARMLIEAVAEEGRRRGWTVIRWITRENNYRARGLYDRLAEKTSWTTYDLKIP